MSRETDSTHKVRVQSSEIESSVEFLRLRFDQFGFGSFSISKFVYL